ncbi:hypothetical protein H0G86_007623 [Trichoderma simmonsii]|uniref:F-box domain-containing protein n=1 Tax=Trichoderma simmonsii TaxID=1491479 RepID=A0A8G0LED4_9HYPO|nr:hypothetical protein H0G86_007623 [Trichoderma simmonsii]
MSAIAHLPPSNSSSTSKQSAPSTQIQALRSKPPQFADIPIRTTRPRAPLYIPIYQYTNFNKDLISRLLFKMSAVPCSGGYPLESPSQSRSSWMYLPPELRLMIMEKVAHDKVEDWESCATINREWQDAIEKENYKKLNLDVSDLDELNVMVPHHKRHLVKHIFFQIDLPRDQSACCARWNPPPSNISKIVKEAIMKLFTALSTWEKGSLTLELNVLSPSDSEHWFKPLYFSSDRTEGDGKKIADLNHGWVNGKQVRFAPEEAVRRMFRPIKLDKSFEREPLPKVVCATKFVIRRQLRRCILPAGISAMLEALPFLESVSYEPWALHETASQNRRRDHVAGMFVLLCLFQLPYLGLS